MRIILGLLAFLVLPVFSAPPTITSVTVQQLYPWKGLVVDIGITFSGASNDVAKATCAFVATNGATRSALTMTHIERAGADMGRGTTWKRHYVWNATTDVGEVQLADVAINVEVKMPLGGVQLWADGPYWAECNVGASKPEEYGYYFWWGGTEGYQRVGRSWNAVDGSKTGFLFRTWNCPTCYYDPSISSLQSLGYIDSTGNLVAAHDAATVHLGAPWRMPTSAEIAALIENCTATWITTNGVYGRLVTGKGDYAAKSIFLPAAGGGYGSDLNCAGSYGRYWSSTPYSNSYSAWDLDFNSGYFRRYDFNRFYGKSVRPVREFAQ